MQKKLRLHVVIFLSLLITLSGWGRFSDFLALASTTNTSIIVEGADNIWFDSTSIPDGLEVKGIPPTIQVEGADNIWFDSTSIPDGLEAKGIPPTIQLESVDEVFADYTTSPFSATLGDTVVINGVTEGATVSAKTTLTATVTGVELTKAYYHLVDQSESMYNIGESYNPADNWRVELDPAKYADGAYKLAAVGIRQDNGQRVYSSTININISTNVVIVDDNESPKVTNISPSNSEKAVPLNQSIIITFSENILQSSINNNIILKCGGSIVDTQINYDDTTNTAIIIPNSDLLPLRTYTVLVSAEIQDLAGNFLASPFSSSFITATSGAPQPVIMIEDISEKPRPGETREFTIEYASFALNSEYEIIAYGYYNSKPKEWQEIGRTTLQTGAESSGVVQIQLTIPQDPPEEENEPQLQIKAEAAKIQSAGSTLLAGSSQSGADTANTVITNFTASDQKTIYIDNSYISGTVKGIINGKEKNLWGVKVEIQSKYGVLASNFTNADGKYYFRKSELPSDIFNWQFPDLKVKASMVFSPDADIKNCRFEIHPDGDNTQILDYEHGTYDTVETPVSVDSGWFGLIGITNNRTLDDLIFPDDGKEKGAAEILSALVKSWDFFSKKDHDVKRNLIVEINDDNQGTSCAQRNSGRIFINKNHMGYKYSTVVIHEYGHQVAYQNNWNLPRGSDSDINEGWAHLASCLVTNNKTIYIGVPPEEFSIVSTNTHLTWIMWELRKKAQSINYLVYAFNKSNLAWSGSGRLGTQARTLYDRYRSHPDLSGKQEEIRNVFINCQFGPAALWPTTLPVGGSSTKASTLAASSDQIVNIAGTIPVDAEGDGLYDTLRVGVNILSPTEEELYLGGFLFRNNDERGVFSASLPITPSPDPQTVWLDFPGEKIYKERLSGPLKLAGLFLKDAQDNIILVSDQTYTLETTAQDYAQYQTPPAYFTGVYADVSAGTPVYAEISISAEVYASEAGDYTVSGVLTRNSDSASQYTSTQAHLEPGNNSVVLSFPLQDYPRSASDTSFTLYQVMIEGDTLTVVDEDTKEEGLITTGVYAASNLAGALITLSGQPSVSPVDLDSDGQYENLSLVVPVTVYETVFSQVEGFLLSGEGQVVARSVSQFGELSPGGREITLQFEGADIHRSRTDGPYTVQVNLYQGDSVIERGPAQTLTTGSYSYTQFTAADTFELYVLPDEIYIEPANPSPGSYAQVTFTVHNQGVGCAKDVETALAINGKEIFEKLIDIPGYGSTAVTVSVPVEDTIEEIQITADSEDQFDESDNNNNIAVKTMEPSLSATADPADQATDVPVSKTITVTFSEEVAAASNIGGISITGGGTVVSYTYSISGGTLTIDPMSNLEYGTTYNVYIPAASVAGTADGTNNGELTFSFTTAVSEGSAGISGTFTFQVAPESADIPQAEVSLWAVDANRSTATPVLTQQVDITATAGDNNGTFQLTNIEPGVYDITFKLPYSLRAVALNITISQDAMTPVNFGEIILGDTWGEEGPDNVIDVSDYSAILYSFGTVPGDEKYIDTCDLNQDGVVDVSDYSIVLYNFGKYGEVPY